MELTSPSTKELPVQKVPALWIAWGLYLVIMAGTAFFADRVPIPLLAVEGLINGALLVAGAVVAVSWLRKRM